jgi:hypothetical protein
MDPTEEVHIQYVYAKLSMVVIPTRGRKEERPPGTQFYFYFSLQPTTKEASRKADFPMMHTATKAYRPYTIDKISILNSSILTNFFKTFFEYYTLTDF